MSEWIYGMQSACLNCGHCSPFNEEAIVAYTYFEIRGLKPMQDYEICHECGNRERFMYEQGWNAYATEKQVGFMQRLGFENASQNIIKNMARELIDWGLNYERT